MADLRYTVDVDARSAKTSLNGLQSSIASVGAALGVAFGAKEIVQIAARFEDLRTTLGFLFKDVDVGAQAFEQIKKFATESIFTVEDLTNSIIKLKAAGLEPSIEQLKLFADVASVSADSVGALQAMTDLFARTTGGGLGLEDLNRLADRGIPVFTILKERLNLTRLEVGKFGKDAEGAAIILQALTEGLEEMFSGSSAARANNLSQAFSNLEDAIANTADIIGQAGLNKELGDVIRSITELIDQNKLLIQSIGVGLATSIKFVVDNLKILAIALAGAFTVKIITSIVAATRALIAMRAAAKGAAVATAVLQGVTGVGIIKLAAGMAAVAGVVAGIENMTGDAGDEIKKLEEDLEKLSDTGPLSIPDAPGAAPIESLESKLQKVKDKQDKLTRATVNYFNEFKNGVDDMQLAINQEATLLALTEEEANVQRELNTFQRRYFDAIRPMQEKVTQLRMKDTEEAKIQADEIEKQIKQITELYNTTRVGLEEQLRNREKIREEQERIIELEDALNKRIEIRRDLMDTFQDRVRDSNNELKKLNMNPFEVQLKELNEAIDDDLIKAINKVKRQWQDDLITSDEYIAEIKVLEKEATKALNKLTENAKQQREIQRSFEYGWRKAFESYEDNATNAAKAAEKIFKTTTQGMEDMIVNFAKTGKFEFKGFINSILEDLLRSQIQQIMAKTFGGFMGQGGGAGLFGAVGSLLGFANGGVIPTNQPVLVGERGPELLMGASGNRVIPNNQLGGGGNVTYNINAVDAMSFKQMVARDPSFIHAVAMQGGKATPGRR